MLPRGNAPRSRAFQTRALLLSYRSVDDEGVAPPTNRVSGERSTTELIVVDRALTAVNYSAVKLISNIIVRLLIFYVKSPRAEDVRFELTPRLRWAAFQVRWINPLSQSSNYVSAS